MAGIVVCATMYDFRMVWDSCTAMRGILIAGDSNVPRCTTFEWRGIFVLRCTTFECQGILVLRRMKFE